ncbi:hypothetical protein BD410DRAFT_901762 [Rickenella mellea]|uniref:Uncharacterized protein n=1 Tax=Rickenella mellea TaxID=50990 RepID=A0A4Y7PPB9_9AGAM|nr:hypothetical protein BD410DRAFT_901762 [Rickenella mellea]
MTLEQSRDSPVFQPDIKNIEALAALAAKHVRTLIGASEEPFELPTANPERHLSPDEEVKQLRAEKDYIDTQLNQDLQCTEILRRALKSTKQIRFKHDWRHREIEWKLAIMMETRTAKLPRLPGEVLSKICDEYRHMKKEQRGGKPKTTSLELCDIICTGQHVPLKIQVGAVSPQSFRDIILHSGKAPLEVSTSGDFSTSESRHKANRTLRTLKNAMEFRDRWRTLTVEEDNMDAVDFVLQCCQSALPHVRVLNISGKFVEESMERKSWPSVVSMTFHIPCLRVAKVPLGYITFSKWLFQYVTGLCLRLPERLDKPEDLVGCLQNLAGIRRLTLRASGKFHLESYRTETVASMPSLEELELMFDELDIDILTRMLRSFLCQNVRKYIAHFDPLFEHYEVSTKVKTRDPDFWERWTKESHDFTVDLWSFLNEIFPALEDITFGNHHMKRSPGDGLYLSVRMMTAWDADFMSILAEPLDAVGVRLFSRLSSITFGASKYEEQHLQCDTTLRLAIARAQQHDVSDIHSVMIYGLHRVKVEFEFDALRFHIPNLHFEWTDERSNWTEGWLFTV